MGDDLGAGAGTPVPQYEYVKVADDLQERIGRGELPLGARLPSEPDMGREYGVASRTARRAVQELRARGLVSTLPSKGTYVIAKPDSPGGSVTPGA